jgi:hypothetical protein
LKSIDTLNVGLIVISLILAYFLPFELFLFSYAVLGPLHYATEINWLDKKNYFIKSKKWIYTFLVLCLILSIPHIFNLPYFNKFNDSSVLKNLIKYSSNSYSTIILICFLMAIGFIYLEKTKSIIIYGILSLFIANYVISTFSTTQILFTFFVPTIIHVYLFTLLFMIYGTINEKTFPGILAIVFLILVPFFVSFYPINTNNYSFSDTTRDTFYASGMHNLNYYIATSLSNNNDGKFLLISEIGLKIQVFVAFCYTYHYLNWFSKTSIIGWNKNVSKIRIFVILAIWIASIGLYFYNYKVGLSALFFLSMLHVLYEFPLNVTTIKLILKKLFTPKTT